MELSKLRPIVVMVQIMGLQVHNKVSVEKFQLEYISRSFQFKVHSNSIERRELVRVQEYKPR